MVANVCKVLRGEPSLKQWATVAGWSGLLCSPPPWDEVMRYITITRVGTVELQFCGLGGTAAPAAAPELNVADVHD
jgi:hypothetical protein